MIDSHCHLDHEPLLSDLLNVIQRSKNVGIKKLLTISTSLESFSKIKEIVNKDDMIYGTIGIILIIIGVVMVNYLGKLN